MANPTTPGARAFSAFISYRQVEPDRSVARGLHRILEAYRTPTGLTNPPPDRRLEKVFLDHEELAATISINDSIHSALRDSRNLIVLCSPRSRESSWIADEIAYFVSLGRRKQMHFVLLEGEFEDTLPPEVRASLRVPDATGDRPLYVDIRTGSVAKSNRQLEREKLRLIAPLLGCDYDDLHRRQQLRRVAQLRLGLGALAVFTLLISLFGAWAFNQKRLAERRLAEALGVADAVLFDLETELAVTPEASRARDHLTGRAEQLLETLGAEGAPSEQTDRLLVVAHLRAGDLAVTSARSSEALREFHLGLALARRRLAAAPDAAQPLGDLALALERIGDVRLDLGDPPGARTAYVEAMHLGARVLRHHDVTLGNQRNQAALQGKVVALERRLGNTRAAMELADESLETRRIVFAAYPGDRELGIELSGALRVEADLRPVDALGNYDAALAVIEPLLAAHSDDASLATEVAILLMDRGVARQGTGDLDNARNDLVRAEKLRRGLQSRGDRDALGLIRTLRSRASLELLAPDLPAAAARLDEVLPNAEALAKADPDNMESLRELSSLYEVAGDFEGLSKDASKSVARYEEAVATARRILAQARTARNLRDLKGLLQKVAMARMQADEDLAAGKAYSEALALSQEVLRLNPTDLQSRREHLQHVLDAGQYCLDAHEQLGDLGGDNRAAGISYLDEGIGRLAELSREPRTASSPADAALLVQVQDARRSACPFQAFVPIRDDEVRIFEVPLCASRLSRAFLPELMRCAE